jgi:hypothetical protein
MAGLAVPDLEVDQTVREPANARAPHNARPSETTTTSAPSSSSRSFHSINVPASALLSVIHVYCWCVCMLSVNSPFGNNVVIDCGMMLNVAFASMLCVRMEAGQIVRG